MRPRPVYRVNSFMERWWPIAVTVAAGAIVGTMLIVSFAALDENAQLTELVESSRRSERNREQRLGEAVGQVEQVLQRQMEHHDAETDAMLDDLLNRIEHLLRRPAGVGSDPIVVESVAPTPTSRTHQQPARQPTEPFRPPGGTEAAPSTTAGTTTTTTAPEPTTPRRRSCDRRPDGPHC